MKRVPLAKAKDQLSAFLREARKQDIIITRHGRPAGVLIGFETEDDWFEYKLQHDPRFQKRVAKARAALRDGKGVPWAEIEKEES